MILEDWKVVEERLKSLHWSVELMCDGYNITIRLERLNQFKNVILVYVNDEIKMKWLGEDCEERRRFFRPVKKSIFSQKQKASLKKMSKRSGLIDPDASYTYYAAYWTSFRALKSHLTKNNSTIELVREQKDGEWV